MQERRCPGRLCAEEELVFVFLELNELCCEAAIRQNRGFSVAFMGLCLHNFGIKSERLPFSSPIP